jgi:hypothetical protein
MGYYLIMEVNNETKNCQETFKHRDNI